MSLDSVTIDVAPTRHVTVPVALEGLGTYAFVLDTGAEGSAVYAPFAGRVGLQPSGATDVLVGQTGSVAVPGTHMPAVALGPIRREGITAIILPPRADGADLAGVVGLDVFGDSLLDFDFPARRVSFHPSGSAVTGRRPLAAAVTAGQLLTVPVTLNGERAVAVLDTGARKSRINWVLGARLGLSPDSLPEGEIIHGGTNTPLATRETRIADVALGERRLAEAPVLVADLPVFRLFGVDREPAMILGLDWLVHTRMLIDFPQRQVWFIATD